MANQEQRRRRVFCDQSRSGKVVIGVQIISWCAVGALLMLRGITTLYGDSYNANNSTASVQEPQERGVNSTSEIRREFGTTEEYAAAQHNELSTAAPKKRADKQQNVKIVPKINLSSAILITVGGTMLVIGPVLLLARIIDSNRHSRKAIKFSKVDPPPSYDEVVDKVPRYSTLFQVTESGELILLPTHNTESSTSVPV